MDNRSNITKYYVVAWKLNAGDFVKNLNHILFSFHNVRLKQFETKFSPTTAVTRASDDKVTLNSKHETSLTSIVIKV